MREKVFQPYSIGPRADATPGVPFIDLGFYVPREPGPAWIPFISAEIPKNYREKVQNDILVLAFMSPENRGWPSQGLAAFRV